MWTDNASKIDMLFYKPYAEIVSDMTYIYFQEMMWYIQNNDCEVISMQL